MKVYTSVHAIGRRKLKTLGWLYLGMLLFLLVCSLLVGLWSSMSKEAVRLSVQNMDGVFFLYLFCTVAFSFREDFHVLLQNSVAPRTRGVHLLSAGALTAVVAFAAALSFHFVSQGMSHFLPLDFLDVYNAQPTGTVDFVGLAAAEFSVALQFVPLALLFGIINYRMGGGWKAAIFWGCFYLAFGMFVAGIGFIGGFTPEALRWLVDTPFVKVLLQMFTWFHQSAWHTALFHLIGAVLLGCIAALCTNRLQMRVK